MAHGTVGIAEAPVDLGVWARGVAGLNLQPVSRWSAGEPQVMVAQRWKGPRGRRTRSRAGWRVRSGPFLPPASRYGALGL